MDLIPDGIAFAALMVGQLAAVIAVRAERKRSRAPREASRTNHHTRLIWEGGGS